MMETELNGLHESVILSNIYPITKANFGKTAYYSIPYGSFAQSQMSMNRRNLNKTMKTNEKQFYEFNKKTRSTRVKNRDEENIEENEENEKNEEIEKSKKKLK